MMGGDAGGRIPDRGPGPPPARRRMSPNKRRGGPKARQGRKKDVSYTGQFLKALFRRRPGGSAANKTKAPEAAE
jgi:hypothetical protein